MSIVFIFFFLIIGGVEIFDVGLGGDEDVMVDVVDLGFEEEGFVGDGGWDGVICDCWLIGVFFDLVGRIILIFFFCGIMFWSFVVFVIGVFFLWICEICLVCFFVKGGMFLF